MARPLYAKLDSTPVSSPVTLEFSFIRPLCQCWHHIVLNCERDLHQEEVAHYSDEITMISTVPADENRRHLLVAFFLLPSFCISMSCFWSVFAP